jgi:hypothetical protein
MDQKFKHSRELHAARERVIAQCRKLAAVSGPDGHRRGPEELGDDVIAVENTIAAIDRLLGGKIASGKVLSFPTKTRQPPQLPTMSTNGLRRPRTRFQAGS